MIGVYILSLAVRTGTMDRQTILNYTSIILSIVSEMAVLVLVYFLYEDGDKCPDLYFGNSIGVGILITLDYFGYTIFSFMLLMKLNKATRSINDAWANQMSVDSIGRLSQSKNKWKFIIVAVFIAIIFTVNGIYMPITFVLVSNLG